MLALDAPKASADDAVLLSDDDDAGEDAASRVSPNVPIAVLGALFAAVCIYLIVDRHHVMGAAQVVLDFMLVNPWLGFVGFVTLYTTNSVLCLPVFPLILGIGFVSIRMHGVFPGIPMACLEVLTAASVAGAVVFGIGRNACRSQVHRWATRSKAIHVEELLMRHKGLQIVALLRLASFLPFGATSYALSVTSVRFRDYFLGTIAGLLPFVVVEVSAGGSLTSLSSATAADSPPEAASKTSSSVQIALLAVSFLVTLFTSIYITRMARAELAAMRERHARSQIQRLDAFAVEKDVTTSAPATTVVSLQPTSAT